MTLNLIITSTQKP